MKLTLVIQVRSELLVLSWIAIELSVILSAFVVENFSNDWVVDWTLAFWIETIDSQEEELTNALNVELVSALVDKLW